MPENENGITDFIKFLDTKRYHMKTNSQTDWEMYDQLSKLYVNDTIKRYHDECCVCKNKFDKIIFFGGNDYCEACLEKQLFKCHFCKKDFDSKKINFDFGVLACAECLQKNQKCSDCSEWYLKSEESKAPGVCSKCFKNKYVFCDFCNSYHKKGKAIEYRNLDDDKSHYVCKKCYEKGVGVSKCEDCGNYLFNNVKQYVMEDTMSKRICSHCYERNYFTCLDCERTYHVSYRFEQNENHCKKCNPEPVVLNYSYKPFRLKFTTLDKEVDPVFFGIEFEIGGCSRESNVKKLVEMFTNRGLLYFKRDASIPNYGCEIVSHPATHKAHKDVVPWKNIFKSIKELGINEYQGCGLHVHVGRDKLSKDEICFLDCFININFEFVEEFCGRKLNSYCTHVLKRRSEWGIQCYGRHNAVNISNSSTVEFRFCSSTNKYDVFMKRLDFVCSLVFFAKKFGFKAADVFSANDELLKTYVDFCREQNYGFISDHGDFLSKIK